VRKLQRATQRARARCRSREDGYFHAGCFRHRHAGHAAISASPRRCQGLVYARDLNVRTERSASFAGDGQGNEKRRSGAEVGLHGLPAGGSMAWRRRGRPLNKSQTVNVRNFGLVCPVQATRRYARGVDRVHRWQAAPVLGRRCALVGRRPKLRWQPLCRRKNPTPSARVARKS
jgi:hypothetical protein